MIVMTKKTTTATIVTPMRTPGHTPRPRARPRPGLPRALVSLGDDRHAQEDDDRHDRDADDDPGPPAPHGGEHGMRQQKVAHRLSVTQQCMCCTSTPDGPTRQR